MGYEVELKWPNDVLIHGLKVAGILCELVTDGSDPVVIIGIGLNVNGDDFPAELTRVATSLFMLSHEPQDTGAIETALIRDLGMQIARYETRGAPDVERYRRHFRMLGRRVLLSGGEEAEVRGVSDDGGLVVLTETGERILRSGEVKFVGGSHDD
jgi:BirA family biotin operon repressor/biotin-[acetyl-CoA-carboxylase] ligase